MREQIASFLERRERLVVAAIVALAAVLRGLHVWSAAGSDPFFYMPAVDPEVYHRWASRIAGGDWIGDEVFFLSPLYPYFLSAIYALFGPDLLAARIVQAVLGSLSCALLYLVARRAFGRPTAALAGLLAAVYSMSIFYDTVLLVTAIQTPLNLLCVLLLLRAERLRSPWPWLASGLLLGLSTLARPNVLLLGGFVVPWMFFSLRNRLSWRGIALRAALFGLGAALMVLPVTVRNWAVGDDFVLVSSQGGVNLYIGNGPGATGSFRVPSEFPTTRADDPLQQRESYRAIAQRDLGRELKPSEVSGYWTNRTLEQIAEHPGEWTCLLARKLLMLLNHYEAGNSRDYYSSRRFSAVLGLPLVGFGLIAPLALLGMAVGLRRFRIAAPLYGMVLVYALSLVAFFVLAHYRMPVVPFLIAFAAFGVCWLLDQIERRRIVPVLVGAAGLAAAAWVVHLDLYDEESSRYMVEYNLANRFRRMGRREEAIEAYRRSIELNPGYISSHHNLALYCEEPPRDVDCAIRHWKAVLELARARRDRHYFERARSHLERLTQSRNQL
ncbi:MAG: glycosyltransferase family 39 protein [Polyangia bacterium]